jgi:hypothetical protein
MLVAEKPHPESSSAQVTQQKVAGDRFDAALSRGKVDVQERSMPACPGMFFH